MKRTIFFSLVILLLAWGQSAQAQTGSSLYPTAPNTDCSLFPAKDGATTTLALSITSTATALSVYSTASFPACGALKIDNREVVFYTDKTSNKFLNVTRGREGTAALTFAAGVKVEMPVLAIQHNIHSAALEALEAKVGYVVSTPALDKILIGTAAGQSQWLDHTLDRVKDVTITSPTNGHALVYQNGLWVNQAIANSGTVTSVAATVPSVFAVSGSPITTSGTLAITFAGGQTQNRVLASPDGSSGAVALRALVAADIPNLAASKITSGQLANARGGTGVDSTGAGNGYLLIGNGSGFALNPLTAGSGISITNSAGGITVASNIGNDSMTQKVKISKGGSLIGTRQEINFIEGSNATLTIADDSVNNRVSITVSASGTLGVKYNNITNPDGNLALSFGANLSTFNWATGTSTNNLFNLTTDANANGTGYLFNVNTGSGATVTPARLAANGNGVELTAAGLLQSIGSGAIDATKYKGNSAPSASEFSYLSGVTSAIQTQLTARALAATTITAGAGLIGTGDLSANRTFDVGAGAGISVAADSVAIDQSFNPTWTGAHTFNSGTTPGNVVSVLIDQPGSAGQRDSHNILMRGAAYDTSGHNADWKQFVDVTSNAAASSWTLQSRVDSGSFTNRFSVSDGGVVAATSFSGDGSQLTALNASNLASGAVANSLLDSDLAALGNNSSNGLWSRTGSGAGAARTIIGTTNQIVVTNGDGVAGDPVLNIGANVLTNSSTHTLTNKTLDAEDTGNIITTPAKVFLAAAGCNNATAASFWDLPTASAASAACVTGTNIQKGVLDFADTSGGFSAQNTMVLPADFTGNIDANIYWTTTATSGNVKWSLSTSCTATNAAATDDPSFNTASTVTTAAPGTANRVQTSTITNLTITGCSAGKLLHLKIFRDGNDGSDSLSATARLLGIELTLRRAM
ncbi:MAG: hypothetical protein HY231_23920 [Acidobacteria bacterium]|nr:hypothetical protein [Acidobacteriota bacterium]